MDLKYLDNERIYAEMITQTGQKPHLSKTTGITVSEEIPLIRFEPFAAMDFIEQGFSTRLGGISEGVFASMNLTFNRGDEKACVQENFRRIASALHIAPEQMVYSKQTHTTNLLRVGKEQSGMGITRAQDFEEMDALMTNEPGVCLVTAYADCVPVILADPVTRSIGAAHAGWRGTAGDIAGRLVQGMAEAYGCHSQDVTAFIGPSICVDCYEVSEDVAMQFQGRYDEKTVRLILHPGRKPGKYQLNLQMANYFNLLGSGVPADNIYISDMCTCCNPDLLYSHRASGGKRGILCNFIYIKD